MKAEYCHSLFPSQCASSADQEQDESGPYVLDSVSPGVSSFSYASERFLNPRMHKKHLLGQTGGNNVLISV